MRTRLMTALIAIAVMVGMVAPTLAHPNHKVMGTVSHVSADHVIVKDRAGKDQTIKLTKTTKVTRNKKPFKAADIPVGARVVVTVVSHTDFTAKVVEVGVVPTSK
jgi:hypothetical protein